MTVKQIIEALSNYDPDREVFVSTIDALYTIEDVALETHDMLVILV